jgi:hypothetical protein
MGLDAQTNEQRGEPRSGTWNERSMAESAHVSCEYHARGPSVTDLRLDGDSVRSDVLRWGGRLH